MSGPLVLIVDDNARNLKLARDVLRAAGFQTLEATSAAEAIALADEHRPHGRDPALLQRPDRDPGRSAAGRAARLRAARGDGRAHVQWAKRGHDLDFGAGIALGHATCGEVGFEGRSDYAAIGAVTNLASRLADEATGGQILVAQRLYAEVEDEVEVEPAGEFVLKGFQRPVTAFDVIAVRSDREAEQRSPSGSAAAPRP